MADNIRLGPSGDQGDVSGYVDAADDISSVWYRLIKLAFGGLGTATLVSATDGLPVNIVAGSAAGTEYTEDAVAAADPVGGAMILVRRDTPSATEVSADGDNVAAKGNSAGAQYVELLAGVAKIGGDAANGLDVDVTRLPALVAGTANIGDVDVLTVPAPLSTTGGGTEAAALRVTVASDSTGVLSVDDNGGALTVDNAGTFAVQDATAQASLSVMDDWDNAASDGASVSGDVAHDSADAGEPVKIGFKAYSPDGTTPGTAVAELDRTHGKSDLDGIQYVQTMNPQNFSYHDDDTAAVTTDGTVKADPGDGFAVFITDIVFSIGAATASSIFIEEGTTKILGPYYLEAIAGRGLSIHFNTPKRCTASTAVLVTNTGSISFSIDILGFVAAV